MAPPIASTHARKRHQPPRSTSGRHTFDHTDGPPLVIGRDRSRLPERRPSGRDSKVGAPIPRTTGHPYSGVCGLSPLSWRRARTPAHAVRRSLNRRSSSPPHNLHISCTFSFTEAAARPCERAFSRREGLDRLTRVASSWRRCACCRRERASSSWRSGRRQRPSYPGVGSGAAPAGSVAIGSTWRWPRRRRRRRRVRGERPIAARRAVSASRSSWAKTSRTLRTTTTSA